MRELDDGGAIGAALIKTYKRTKDPRYKPVIDIVADFISHKMQRMPDGTLSRPRPYPVSLWVDDMYMSIPFLAQMGDLTGDQKYFDDASRQVIQYADRLMNPATGLFDHAWFAHEPNDPKFYWGRGAGWALMAMAELLSVMPELPSATRQGARHLSPRARVAPPPCRAAPACGTSCSTRPTATSRPQPRRCSPSRSRAASTAAGFSLSTDRSPRPDGVRWSSVSGRMARSMAQCVQTTAAYDAVYYYNRPTDPKAMQGFGAVLMAGAEVTTMLRSFDIQKRFNTFHYFPKKKE